LREIINEGKSKGRRIPPSKYILRKKTARSSFVIKTFMQNKEEARKKMFFHIDQWKRSDQSQKAYCLEHNIRYYVFHYWFKRYRGEDADKREITSSFVKLQVNESATKAHSELIMPDGRRLVFHEAVSSDFLKSLIS